MQEMNGRERVMAALRGEECDRPCWSPLLDGYFASSLPAQGFPRTGLPDLYRMLGADVVLRHVPTVIAEEDPTIVRRSSSGGKRRTDIIETPVGTLTAERGANPWEAWEHTTRFPVRSLADLEICAYMAERTRYRECYSAFRDHSRTVGDDGIATASCGMTPLMLFMEELCGVEGTCFLLADHPAELRTCLERMHAANLEALRVAAEGPAEVIICYEDTSSTLLSPELYRRYCAPSLDEYADLCRAAGKCFLVHMCGKLAAFGADFKAARFDGIESVCPPTTGDIWPHEARAAWGDDKIIFGGLEPAALAWMNIQETTAYVDRVLDALPTFRRFILGTGDATAHGTPVANLRAVSEAVRRRPWK